jgi:hypothetical protein
VIEVGPVALQFKRRSGVVGSAVIPVIIDLWVDVGREVFVADLNSVIDYRDGDASAEEFVPNVGEVGVNSGNTCVLSGVVEVPLIGGVGIASGKAGIVGNEFGKAASGEQWPG